MNHLNATRFGARTVIVPQTKTEPDSVFTQKAEAYIQQNFPDQAQYKSVDLSNRILIVTNDENGRQDKDVFTQQIQKIQEAAQKKFPKDDAKRQQYFGTEGLKLCNAYASEPNPLQKLFNRILVFLRLAKPIHFSKVEV